MMTILQNRAKALGTKELTIHPPARVMPTLAGRGALGGNHINSSWAAEPIYPLKEDLHMSFWLTYLLVVAGIVISVIYPILRQALPRPPAKAAGVPGLMPRIWNAARPYIATLILALVTAPLIMGFLGDKLDNWASALLAGFAWEATIEKVKG
jgi:hypothetical protein